LTDLFAVHLRIREPAAAIAPRRKHRRPARGTRERPPWETRKSPASARRAVDPATSPATYPALAFVPADARLAMPDQDLGRAPLSRRLAEAPPGRRRIVLAGAACIAAVAGGLLLDALDRRGLTILEAVTLGLSVLLCAWVGFGFMSATAGFVAAWRDRRRLDDAPVTPPSGVRTAILMPVHNEDPGLVFSGLEAMAEDLERLGAGDAYDVFVLSDTRDAAIAEAEATAFLRLQMRAAGRAGPRLHYRRRAQNIDRKAGNIAEWVERFGGAYDFMLVLDADSLMTGETILALTAGIARDPGLGLLQSVPTIVNARTPFARLQQFASRLYGPVFAAGQQWWSGEEGNYWGHNAIIRVAAFAESCRLPHLSGPRPWGGHIMSHDFIEAALLRRRGWAVRTLAGLGGSYEEAPPTLLDTAVRDRRWCQGNLQHVRLLGAAGLHWVSRLHLVMGVCAYLVSPLWLALLVCGSLVWPKERFAVGSLAYDEVGAVLVLTLALLAAPKLMALALALALSSPARRRRFGGARGLIAGVALETLASLLLTPVSMVMQAVAVFDVVVGRDSGWKPQRREGVEMSSADAWRAHRGHVLLGVVGGLGAWLTDRYLLVWAGPVFLSLALSAALSFHTSRPRGGAWTSLPRFLRIPEDSAPPRVLVRARALRAAYAAEAPLRRRIAFLLREEPAVYEVKADRRWTSPRQSQAAGIWSSQVSVRA
jgi:membrane glycosyltransferase